MRDQVDWQTGWAPEKLEKPAKAINTSDAVRPRKSQLLKWVGTKQRYARKIISYFPKAFRTYQEPFLGVGGVLGVLAPARARAVETFSPLIGIWSALRDQPDALVGWNRTHWEAEEAGGRTAAYETARARFNSRRDPADLIYFSRAANGGVIRFRPRRAHVDPAGAAPPDPSRQVRRPGPGLAQPSPGHPVRRARLHRKSRPGPGRRRGLLRPTLQPFAEHPLPGPGRRSRRSFSRIERAKRRGAFVALGLIGAKKSGGVICDHDWPAGLFEREVPVILGALMVKRFQMEGRALAGVRVVDLVLLSNRGRG